MHLVIRAQSPHHVSVSPSIVAEFDERGGTIGRSDSNTMALPDPARYVSRLQAEVSCAAGVYSLRNVGNANPIMVNGRPLGHGETVPLQDQDQLTIGGYELSVELHEQTAQAPLCAVDGRTVISASAREAKTGSPGHPGAAPTPMQSDSFAGLLGTTGKPDAADPFADLMGLAPSAAAPATTSAHVASPPPAAARAPFSPAPTPHSPLSPRLPDDFDPFADLAAPAPSLAARSDQDSSLRSLLDPDAAGPGIDTLFGLHAARPGQENALEAFLSPGATTKNDSPLTNDPFAFLGVGNSPPDAVGPAASDDTPDLQAAYTPSPVHAARPQSQPQPQPQPARPQIAAQALPAASDTGALWDAFCEGAQLSLATQPRLTPELMRLIGGTLRQAVEGTLQLSTMRTVVKQELHVPVTTIQTRGNNPLKFAPDAAAALAQMVQPPMRGFMAAPEAMQDAMTDLLGHAAGTMEGTRAALQGMLRRFEPARLEAELAEGGVLDKLMPGNRRARLWELYLQHFGRISESAREDFDDLFGRAFAKAYEEQADRVATARRNNAAP